MIQLFGRYDSLAILIAFAAALFGLVLHNVVQALVASSQGDDSPKTYGFASTDPRVHIEPLYLLFFALLGFAIPRPIPLNPRNVRGRGGPEALVWLSGPLALVLWAFVLLLASSLLSRFVGGEAGSLLIGLALGAQFATSFAAVYLIPVPPLDGARALLAVGNLETRRFMRQLEGYGPIGFLLIFVVLSFTGILRSITNAITGVLLGLLGVFGL